MEGLGDLGVHLDHVVALDGELPVALGHSVLHPSSEDVLEHRVADVREPLLRHLRDLLLVRKILVNHVVRLDEIRDLLDREVIILRDGNMANFFAVDLPLGASN